MTALAQAEAATFRVWVAVDPNGKVTGASVESYMTEEEFRRDYAGPDHVVLLVPGPIVLGSQVKTQDLTAALRLLAQQPAPASAESKGLQRVLRSYTTQGITVEEVPFLCDAETGEFFFDADVAQTLYQALRALPGAEALTEENRRLREALEWYAEPSIYQQEHFEETGMEYPVLVDGGHTARAALAAAEAQP